MVETQWCLHWPRSVSVQVSPSTAVFSLWPCTSLLQDQGISVALWETSLCCYCTAVNLRHLHSALSDHSKNAELWHELCACTKWVPSHDVIGNPTAFSDVMAMPWHSVGAPEIPLCTPRSSEFLFCCYCEDAILVWKGLYTFANIVSNVICIFSCDQAALQIVFSVRLSVCLSHLFHHVPIIVSSWNFQELLPWSKVMSMQKVKVRGQRSRSQMSTPNLAVSRLQLQFEFTYGNEIMHTAESSIEEVPYCFSRSSVKFQGHTALKTANFTQIGRFRTVTPDWIHKWLRNDAQSLK